MYIKAKEIMSSEGLLNELMGEYYEEVVEKLEEWHEDEPLHEADLETLIEDIEFALCFSFSDPMSNYLMANYEGVDEALEDYGGDDYEDFDEFIDEVLMLKSPFEHPILEDDEVLLNVIKACAKHIKNHPHS